MVTEGAEGDAVQTEIQVEGSSGRRLCEHFGPALLTGRALPDQQASPISHGGSTHAGLALTRNDPAKRRRFVPSPIRSSPTILRHTL